MVNRFLYIIIPIIAGALFWGWHRRKRFLMALHLSPDNLLKALIPISIIILLFAVLHEPAIRQTTSIKEYAGANIVFVVDISLSMRAKDGTNQSRLDKAKEFIISCSDKLVDERVSLVIFAGDAFAWVPFLTTDKSLLNYFTHRLSTDIMSARGTDFAGAVLKAARILEDSSNGVIVLLSDGEIQGENVIDVVEAVMVINELNIGLYVVPLGSSGSFIPMEDGELLKDSNGQLVETRLRLDILGALAKATDGKIVDRPFEIRESSRELIGEKEITKEIPLFWILLVITLLLLVANMLFRK